MKIKINSNVLTQKSNKSAPLNEESQKIYDEFVKRLITIYKSVVIGDALEEKGAMKADHFDRYVDLANAIADKILA